MCLAQGHKAVTLLRLEPGLTPRSSTLSLSHWAHSVFKGAAIESSVFKDAVFEDTGAAIEHVFEGVVFDSEALEGSVVKASVSDFSGFGVFDFSVFGVSDLSVFGVFETAASEGAAILDGVFESAVFIIKAAVFACFLAAPI